MLVDSIKLYDGFIDDGVIETGISLPSVVDAKQGQLFYLRAGLKGLYSFNGIEWEMPSNGGGNGGGGDDSFSWMGGEPSNAKERLGLDGNSSYFGKSVASGSTALLYENTDSNKIAIVKNLIICNPTAASALLTICIKAAGVPVGLSKAIFYRAQVQAGKTVVIDLSSVIANGKGIYATVDTDIGGVATSLSISTIGVQLPSSASAIQMAMLMLTTSWQPVFTTPSAKTALMYQMLAVNGAAENVKVSFQIVPVGGALNANNMLLSDVSLVPNETLMFTTVVPLPTGFMLYAKADKATSINMTLDGTEN